MAHRQPAIVFDVVQGPQAADFSIDDLEALEELETVLQPLLRAEVPRLTVDLRPSVPPRFTLGTVVEALAELLPDADCEGPRVRCLVRSPGVASELARSRAVADRSAARYQVGRLRVQLGLGDLSAVVADAVVNASNTRLVLGSGVSAALRHACGPGLQAEMLRHAPIEPGGLAVTGAHGLHTADTVLHVATASGGRDVVRRALEAVLACCDARGLRRVDVPGVGMGTGGLAAHESASVFCAALAQHGARPPCPSGLETVRVVLWTAADYAAFQGAFDEHPGFGPAGARG